MDSSRRAVESYWRSRMIDAATSDEDKVTPVYKIEEICDLLRSSHVGIVKEVSQFILKRLDHKSPIVKQKALRLIKYAVGKSGVEFKREMQRNSVAVRQLFHYKGHPDPLKGEALNKAVRDTAQEAINAIFSEESSNKPAAAEDINRRIQGFGSTNYEMPSEDKRSFLSEVVGLGSSSIKQGINSFTQGHSHNNTENGSYKSPNLRRSLTTESNFSDRYEPVKLHGNQGGFGVSQNTAGGSWGQNSGVNSTESEYDSSTSRAIESKSREEKLVETIVTSGGVRLQPTRDAIQVFLVEAAKLDSLALSHALDSKLQSPVWQVRMKGVCLLESILRKKDDEPFSAIASYFNENIDVVLRCQESPQSSLREKANKVLNLLDRQQESGMAGTSGNFMKTETSLVHDIPDLIDTSYPDNVGEDFGKSRSVENEAKATPSSVPLIDDLFVDGMGTGISSSEQKTDDDPFADVSFHMNGNKEAIDDLFSTMTVDDKPASLNNHVVANKNETELFDIFGSSSQLKPEHKNSNEGFDGLMSGLSVGDITSNQTSFSTHSGNDIAASNGLGNHSNPLSSILGSQESRLDANPVFPLGAVPYNIPPGMFANPNFASQQMNYGAMGNLLAQQQFLATMSNLQHLGNLNAQYMGSGPVTGITEANPSPIPDIFNSNLPTHSSGSVNSRKEETRAFDFISDHVAAARDPKRVA